jgi:hypothetical protein
LVDVHFELSENPTGELRRGIRGGASPTLFFQSLEKRSCSLEL